MPTRTAFSSTTTPIRRRKALLRSAAPACPSPGLGSGRRLATFPGYAADECPLIDGPSPVQGPRIGTACTPASTPTSHEPESAALPGVLLRPLITSPLAAQPGPPSAACTPPSPVLVQGALGGSSRTGPLSTATLACLTSTSSSRFPPSASSLADGPLPRSPGPSRSRWISWRRSATSPPVQRISGSPCV